MTADTLSASFRAKGERKPGGSDPGCFVDDKLTLGGQPKDQFPRVEQSFDGGK